MTVYNVGDDWYFTCEKGHIRITSPRYNTKEKAEAVEKTHVKRMQCDKVDK